MLVEVSDTTLAYDRRTKLPLYSEAGIVEVWIVDGQAETVESFRSPTESGYTQSTLYRRDASLSPAQLPAVSIHIDYFFFLLSSLTSTLVAVILYLIVTREPFFRSPSILVSFVRAISHFSLSFSTVTASGVTSSTGPVT